jgi:hypothetical protein
MLFMAFGLYLDSQSLSRIIPHNQLLANIAMIALFIWTYRNATRKLQKMMFYGMFIALGGECLLSLGLGMYEYRLENVPVYVPPGHAVVYASVYYFVRDPWVLKHQVNIERILLAFAIVYGVFWLFVDHDLFGFLCLVGFVLLFRYNKKYFHNAKSRLFALSMFTLVAYLEQFGTFYGCWYWPTVAFDSWSWLPSGNPPSAIALFYLAFDRACVKAYLYMHRQTHFRLQGFRAALQYK